MSLTNELFSVCDLFISEIKLKSKCVLTNGSTPKLEMVIKRIFRHVRQLFSELNQTETISSIQIKILKMSVQQLTIVQKKMLALHPMFYSVYINQIVFIL